MNFTEMFDSAVDEIFSSDAIDELFADKKAKALEQAKKIKMVIFDVDGTLTDGGIYMSAEGELFKAFNCRDGMGFTVSHGAGLLTGIITGRTSKILTNRAAELKIPVVYQGISDKRTAYAQIKEQYNLQDDEIAYVGDDLNDLPLLMTVGLPCVVNDAVPEAKQAALYRAAHEGGKGAARDIFEFILKAQGKWEGAIAKFTGADEVKNVSQ